MKKNFLKIAAMLIAAMLLVVSCSQEVAPKNENNGLVVANLNVAYGRDLTVSGDTKQDAITLYYKMTPGWTISGAKEDIYGATKDSNGQPEYRQLNNVNQTGNLGHVTPGLWNIEVVAKGHNGNGAADSTDIFYGTASVYFNETTKSATVFLAPASSKSNTLSFNFNMQALSEQMDGDTPDYVLEYKLCKDGASFPATGTQIPCTSVDNGVCTFSVAPFSVESGFYRVNVSIYRKPKTEQGSYEKEVGGADKKVLVGGVTKGFLVAGGATVVIGGNIEPSDYEKVSINTYYVKVDTEFSNNKTINYYKGAITSGDNEPEVRAPNYAEVTVSIDDSTSNSMIGSGFTKTNYWSVVSDKEEKVLSQTNADTCTFTVENGGIKTVTCTTIYTIEDPNSTTNPKQKYYFAKTVTKQILVDPVSIENASAEKPVSQGN